MPDEESEKPGGEAEADRSAADAEENDRPTVSPPFDPIAFARDVLKPSPAPMPAVKPSADAHTRVTPPAGTEQQAAAAEASRPSGRSPRRKTPTSTLSLANARIPSNLPPARTTAKPDEASRRAPPKPHEPPAGTSPPERPWAELELETRPPPPDGPSEDPLLELARDRTPPVGLDDIGFDDDEHEAATVRRPITGEIAARGGAVDPLVRAERHEPASAGRAALGPETRESAKPDRPAKPRDREMNDRVELGDYSGALEIAEEILAVTPGNVGAKAVAETCRTVLRQMYAARIGPLDRVPVVMVPRDQLRWLSIDHKAGFVLSLVDGVSSLEMIIDVSGMPELDTLRILSELAQQRIISLR